MDEVSYNGNAYVALKTVTGVTPSDDGVNWRLFMSSADVDANVLVPKFTEASTRSNIVSGENLSTMFGKIKKWFTDLKSHAFKDLVNNLTTETTGSALDASQGKILKDEVDGVNRKLSGIEEGAEATAATISGSNPTVTNSANAPLIYGKIKGYSEQKTLSGKNLLKITNPTQTTDGITFTVNEDGNITINGTATADTNFNVTLIANITGNGKIKRKLFQLNGSYTGTVEHWAFTSEWGHGYFIPIGEESFLNTDVTYNVFRIKVSSGTVCNNLKVGFMVAEDVSEYEPFCGGIASPNPDYPQDIKGVGDSGTIEVKTCGKNLFNVFEYNTYTTNGITFTPTSDGGINVKGTSTAEAYYSKSFYLPREDSYVISGCPNGGDWSTYCLGYWGAGLGYSVDSGNSAIINPTDISEKLTLRITIGSGQTIDKTFYPMVRPASVEDDTYEPYTETQALIPVSSPLYDGDYIEVFADGSGQIVRENGSYTANNASGWRVENTVTSRKRLRNNTVVVGKAIGSAKEWDTTIGKCNQLISATPLNTWNGDIDNCFAIDNNGFLYVYSSSLQTIESFTTQVTNNPMTFLYKLATPITEPLTAEQVAEFMKLQTFKGVTHINADGEVTVRYYCNTDSGYTVGMLQEQAKENLEQIKNDLSTHTHNYAGSDKPGGSATYALQANKDGAGNVIDATYINKTYMRNYGAGSIAFGNNMFIGIFNGDIICSSDGQEWEVNFEPNLFSLLDNDEILLGITYGNEKFVSFSNKGCSYVSSDNGNTWTKTQTIITV